MIDVVAKSSCFACPTLTPDSNGFSYLTGRFDDRARGVLCKCVVLCRKRLFQAFEVCSTNVEVGGWRCRRRSPEMLVVSGGCGCFWSEWQNYACLALGLWASGFDWGWRCPPRPLPVHRLGAGSRHTEPVDPRRSFEGRLRSRGRRTVIVFSAIPSKLGNGSTSYKVIASIWHAERSIFHLLTIISVLWCE